MATIIEVEKTRTQTPGAAAGDDSQANLLESFPAVLSDEDEGIGEALRRDAEIDADPNHAISFAQLDSQIQNRRG